MLTSEGRDLRRALFSLKQIFQEDKDLVHGFVALGGLNCLVRVGSGADQNYQNYILRALGQVNSILIAKNPFFSILLSLYKHGKWNCFGVQVPWCSINIGNRLIIYPLT